MCLRSIRCRKVHWMECIAMPTLNDNMYMIPIERNHQIYESLTPQQHFISYTNVIFHIGL
jgi:hypothetical protein